MRQGPFTNRVNLGGNPEVWVLGNIVSATQSVQILTWTLGFLKSKSTAAGDCPSQRLDICRDYVPLILKVISLQPKQQILAADTLMQLEHQKNSGAGLISIQ